MSLCLPCRRVLCVGVRVCFPLNRYATEKLWQGLLAGSVPVYWGAPDAKSLLPHPDAAVHASDFRRAGGGGGADGSTDVGVDGDHDGGVGSLDTLALAAYLLDALSDPTGAAYAKHMAWKSLPVSFARNCMLPALLKHARGHGTGGGVGWDILLAR